MEAITNYFYGNNSTQENWRVGMNKIGTAHVLLSDSIHTLPIEEENDGRGGLCESWSAMGVSSLSMMVVLLRLASASRKQIRDRGRRCWGRGSVYDDDGGPAPVRCTRSSIRQMRCGGRVRRCRRRGARRLRCRGEVYFAVGIENGEYSGVLLWVRGGVGWVGWTWSYENSPLPSVIRRPVPKAMMVTSHCSNQGRGRFSRRPQNFVTLDSPCGVLSDSAKQLASSSSKLCILGLTEVKLPKVWPSL